MSESLDEEGCEAFARLSFVREETNDILRIVGLIVFLFGIIYFPITFIVFIRSRKTYDRMKKRSIGMIFLSLFAMFIFMFGSPLRLAIGIEIFPCTFLMFTTSFVVIMTVVTNIVRMYRLNHRVYYSKLLLDKAFETFKKQEQSSILETSQLNEEKQNIKKDIFELYLSKILYFCSCWSCPSTLEEDLKYHYFLTTSNYTSLLFFMIFILTTGPTLSLVYIFLGDSLDNNCVGCLANFGSQIYVPVFIIASLLCGYILYKTYSFPDILGIRRELFINFCILVGLHLFIVTPIRFFFPFIERDNVFDLSLITSFGFFLVAFYLSFYQIWLSKKQKQKVSIEEELEDVLCKTEGRKAFAVYLTHSLTVENLLFYEQVKKWKADYSIKSEAKMVLGAKQICDLFVLPGSTYEINVGYFDRKAVIDIVTDDDVDQLKENIFDDCQREIEGFVQIQFSGFLHSKLYQVYKSNIGEVTGLKDLET